MNPNGNLIVGQSGGPTCVINSSLFGIIDEARRRVEIGKIYGAIYGIEGILKRRIVDLDKELPENIEGLKTTPGAALGGCRYMLGSDDPKDEGTKGIFELFDHLGVRYVLYIGGNDSMDTANKIASAAQRMGYPLQVIGVPKTVDNDLVLTHHCPGYGSAAKYVAASVREAGLHAESMRTSEPVTILVTVGRNAGWLPAASALARNGEEEAPHLICFPEVLFSLDRFLADVERVYRRTGSVFIVSGEGLQRKSGDLVVAKRDDTATDPFGHPELGGIGDYLKEEIERRLGLHTRIIRLDICQQSAMHFASLTDQREAELAGRKAIEYALEGRSRHMVTLVVPPGPNYRCITSAVELSAVANRERRLPREWINAQGNHVVPTFLDYVHPLIQGEVKIPLEGGLPVYKRLSKAQGFFRPPDPGPSFTNL